MIVEGITGFLNHYGYKTKKSLYDLRDKGMPVHSKEMRDRNFVVLYDTDAIDSWMRENNIIPPIKK